jgi:hypothetical protein
MPGYSAARSSVGPGTLTFSSCFLAHAKIVLTEHVLLHIKCTLLDPKPLLFIIIGGDSGQYSSVAQKLMSKMGYKSGTGLGKKGQGIVEPVGISKQKGRRGLGLILEGLEEETVNWDGSREHVVIKEKPDWMPRCSEPCPEIEGGYLILDSQHDKSIT